MTSSTARISKLERTIREKARSEFVAAVHADFAASLDRAAANDDALKLLKDARGDIIRKGQRAAEEAALEAFLAERAPLPANQPRLIRLDATGKRLADDDGSEHIAVLVTGVTAGHDWLIDARLPVAVDSIRDAAEKAAEIQLYGEPLQLLSDVVWQAYIIDRTKRDPAVHPFFAKNSPTDRWYPTSAPLMEKNGKPNSSGCVWAVYLHGGDVGCVSPSDDGFVRGGRLVPAREF